MPPIVVAGSEPAGLLGGYDPYGTLNGLYLALRVAVGNVGPAEDHPEHAGLGCVPEIGRKQNRDGRIDRIEKALGIHLRTIIGLIDHVACRRHERRRGRHRVIDIGDLSRGLRPVDAAGADESPEIDHRARHRGFRRNDHRRHSIRERVAAAGAGGGDRGRGDQRRARTGEAAAAIGIIEGGWDVLGSRRKAPGRRGPAREIGERIGKDAAALRHQDLFELRLNVGDIRLVLGRSGQPAWPHRAVDEQHLLPHLERARQKGRVIRCGPGNTCPQQCQRGGGDGAGQHDATRRVHLCFPLPDFSSSDSGKISPSGSDKTSRSCSGKPALHWNAITLSHRLATIESKRLQNLTFGWPRPVFTGSMWARSGSGDDGYRPSGRSRSSCPRKARAQVAAVSRWLAVFIVCQRERRSASPMLRAACSASAVSSAS